MGRVLQQSIGGRPRPCRFRVEQSRAIRYRRSFGVVMAVEERSGATGIRNLNRTFTQGSGTGWAADGVENALFAPLVRHPPPRSRRRPDACPAASRPRLTHPPRRSARRSRRTSNRRPSNGIVQQRIVTRDERDARKGDLSEQRRIGYPWNLP